MNAFTEKLRTLIGENQTELVLQALIEFFKDKDSDLYHQAILHHATLKKTEQDAATNLIGDDEAEQNHARINYAVLQMTGQIEQLKFDVASALSHIEQLEKKTDNISHQLIRYQRSRKLYLVGGAVLTGLAGIIFIIIWRMQPDPSVKAEGLYQEARKYRHLENLDKTIEFSTKTLKIMPDHYNALNLRAECYMLKNKLDLAFIDIQKAIQLKPNDPGYIYSTMAQIESLRGNTEGFYRFIDSAMTWHIPIWDFSEEPGIKEHSDEARFKEITEDFKKASNN